MGLYFKRANGEYIKLSDFANNDNVLEMINNFCKAHNYQNYYTRAWQDEDNQTWFDVGSHTEFFVLTNKVLTKED